MENVIPDDSKYYMTEMDSDIFTAQAAELRTFAYAALNLSRDATDDTLYPIGHWPDEMRDWAFKSLVPFLDVMTSRLPELAKVFLDTSWDCYYLRENADKADSQKEEQEQNAATDEA